MTNPLTNDDKIKALEAVALDVEGTISHLADLLKDQKEVKGRYESSGGVPLPDHLRERLEEKSRNLSLGHTLITKAIENLKKV